MKYIVGVIGLLLLFSVSINVFLFFSPPQRVRQSSIANYPLIARRVFASNPNDVLIRFVELRTQLQSYLQNVDEPLGMYFEYLPSGISIGIHDRDNFILASLLKVPIVMAVYKQVEDGTISFDTTITMKDTDVDKGFGTLWQKGPGATFTVKQLIYETLVHSDNTAKNMLGRTVTPDAIADVFNSLDIPEEVDKDTPVVSPKNYSSVLRSLYLSSYLTNISSNEILSLLTQTPFNDKIASPVPHTILVAHKIGVHDEQNTDTPVFTDCGIFYIPQRPYILCIMTKSTEEKATEHMSTISKLIYAYIRKANK